jgi:ankyrin repeat protein
MTALMQVAGGRGIEAEVQAARRNRQRVTDADLARWSVTKVKQALQRGEDVNAIDETGWTALMMAAVMGQPQSVSALIDAGARVDQRNDHGDTALIGAASVRFMDLHVAAEVVRILLQHGASVEATNDLGESALMWAARAGNPESIQLLLQAGANPLRTDRSDHDALFYLRNARDNLRFDPALVQRYVRAESVLK